MSKETTEFSRVMNEFYEIVLLLNVSFHVFHLYGRQLQMSVLYLAMHHSNSTTLFYSETVQNDTLYLTEKNTNSSSYSIN